MGTNNELNDINGKLIDLELAKNDNKNSKVRRYLPAFVLVASVYYSFYLAIGLAVGYLASRLFAKYFIEKGRVDSIYIDVGNWKFHLHHWISGAVILLIVWVIDYFYLPRFLTGVILGVIAHDIYDYNDWHKILVKNEEK